MDKVEFNRYVAQTLIESGVAVKYRNGYYLPADTLLTGAQVSAAVKTDPDRLAARYNGMYAGDEEAWTGNGWEYSDGSPSALPPDEFDSQFPSWHLVYRDPVKTEPQVFHSLAEYVAWGEHPDRLNRVSGRDAEGWPVGIGQTSADGTRGVQVGRVWGFVTLPITAVFPED